ncbi:MAG: tetratricopeptide repeat protein [Candidatus Thorarchaeota archaeon]
MISHKSDEVQQIEHLMNEGKYENAIDEIEVFETQSHITSNDLIELRILKCTILTNLEKWSDALDLVEKYLVNYSYLGYNIYTFDLLFIRTFILVNLNRIDEALTSYDKCINALSKISDYDDSEISIRKAKLYYIKGILLEKQNDMKTALEQYLLSLSLYRELDIRPNIAQSLEATARIYFFTGDAIRAQLIFDQALEIYKELDNEIKSASVLNFLGEVFAWKGDYGLALEHSLQSLSIVEEIDHKPSIGRFLYSISTIFYQLGELDRALEYLERSLSIFEELNLPIDTTKVLNYLSLIFYRKGEIEQARNYLNQIKEINGKLDDKNVKANIRDTEGKINLLQGNLLISLNLFKESLDLRENERNRKASVYSLFWIIYTSILSNDLSHIQFYLQKVQKIIEKEKNEISSMVYQLASAMVLKTSNKLDVLQKAKESFVKIIDGVLLDHEIKCIAMYNLAELLIKIIELYSEKDEIQYLDNLIQKHYDTAKMIGSQIMFAENFWLKVQLAMIRHKYQDAKNYLHQTQQITEDKGLRKLAMDIPGMQKIIDSFFKIDTSPSSITTQINFERKLNSTVDDDVIRMVDKRHVEMPKIQDEEPVLLIIIYEGGVTIFSKKFSQKEMIDEMFVGGFLTAIDAFMHQTFATGGSIERIKHQEYTLLLKGEKPLLFCYVHKGQSFSAIQKLDKVITELKKSISIWHSLTNNLGEQLTKIEREAIDKLAQKIFLIE